MERVLFFSKDLDLLGICRNFLKDRFEIISTCSLSMLKSGLEKCSYKFIIIDYEYRNVVTEYLHNNKKQNVYFVTTRISHESVFNEIKILFVPLDLNILLEEFLFDDNIEIPEFDNLVGISTEIKELKKEILKIAKSELPVLIMGESGVGKNLIANLIHSISTRKNNVFYHVNIASIATHLLESELFGTVSGAFTGAENREGFFQSADKGSLFLDEIGELDYSVQAKILHSLESGMYKKVGSDKDFKLNARLLFATNANLLDMVEKKKFRLDLYYRINKLILNVPPLRSRKEDIIPLSKFYLSKKGKTLSSDALSFLMEYSWPGNIRELFNVLDSSAIRCTSETIDKSFISLA
ncbi:MAG: sigma-54-dependent Fis family transcriptional regulator [Treponema sp.]|nr:sigma-54-dependent Fis family transcriptional regulator [Treponema sp.]